MESESSGGAKAPQHMFSDGKGQCESGQPLATEYPHAGHVALDPLPDGTWQPTRSLTQERIVLKSG
eukprot:14228713-Alexandrium_andersonii.AAC.1